MSDGANAPARLPLRLALAHAGTAPTIGWGVHMHRRPMRRLAQPDVTLHASLNPPFIE